MILINIITSMQENILNVLIKYVGFFSSLQTPSFIFSSVFDHEGKWSKKLKKLKT